MKLLTKEIKEKFAKVGRQEDVSDPLVVAKFFDPQGSWTWYATEFDPENEIFFGWVHGLVKEWGSFSLEELQSYTGPFMLGIERDIYFGYQRISEIK